MESSAVGLGGAGFPGGQADPFAAPVPPPAPTSPPQPPRIRHDVAAPVAPEPVLPPPGQETVVSAAHGASPGASATPDVQAANATTPSGGEAKEKVEPERKVRGRATSIASGGRPVEAPGPPPGTPSWPDAMNLDEVYVPEEFDVTDLMEVNREMNRARARLFRVSQALKLVQRTLAEAQSEYDRAFRRQMVSISGGTEASRKAMAEIACEAYENRIIVGRQVVEEWRKRAVDCRDDLKAIENIAHNVRAQMDIR